MGMTLEDCLSYWNFNKKLCAYMAEMAKEKGSITEASTCI